MYNMFRKKTPEEMKESWFLTWKPMFYVWLLPFIVLWTGLLFVGMGPVDAFGGALFMIAFALLPDWGSGWVSLYVIVAVFITIVWVVNRIAKKF